MEGRYMTVVRFHVRTVSLQQLAALWSTVMALVPEVRGGSATFERRGQPTEHEYVYRDADELARAGLEVEPGELRLRSIRVLGPETSVEVHERGGADFLSAVLVLPNALCVDITGSNERDVLKIRDTVERWVARNLATTRRALWLKLGALVAGIVGICGNRRVWVSGQPSDRGHSAVGPRRRPRLLLAIRSSRASTPDVAASNCQRRAVRWRRAWRQHGRHPGPPVGCDHGHRRRADHSARRAVRARGPTD